VGNTPTDYYTGLTYTTATNNTVPVMTLTHQSFSEEAMSGIHYYKERVTYRAELQRRTNYSYKYPIDSFHLSA